MKKKESNPWKTHSSEIVYKNKWITLIVDQVTTPGGSSGIYSYLKCKPAVGVIAINEEDEIYLVGQYRYPMEEYTWEIIEGGGEEGEDTLTTAKRELKEEAGIVAQDFELICNNVHISNCHSDERAYIYLAKNLSFVKSTPEDTEDLKVKKVHISKAFEMLDNNEILDSMSMIGLYKLRSLIS